MKLVMCNSLPTSRIFGEKVDAAWYARQGVDNEYWDQAPPVLPQEKLEALYAGAAANRYIGPNHRIFTEWAESEQSHDALVARPHLFWHLSRFDRMYEQDILPDSLNRNGATYVFQHFDLYDKTVVWINILTAPVGEARQVNVGSTCGMCGPDWSLYAGTAMANCSTPQNGRRGGFCRWTSLSGAGPVDLRHRSKSRRRRWLGRLIGSD